jgi:glucosamine-6-phosphate deaminase
MPFRIEILPDEPAMAARAANDVIDHLKRLLATQPRALVMFATGMSQFEFLRLLVAAPGIAWDRIDMCHLDEYIGLPRDHPASFHRYLDERLFQHVRLGSRLMIDGLAADPVAECARLKLALSGRRIDLAFVGIGENGHLAFNDPPADFETKEPYIIVELDEPCRRQQVGEGWFPDIASVPSRAITASIGFILSARRISGCVPGTRKAQAVKDCLTVPITPLHPASALRRHDETVLYLDRDSASLLPDPQP